MALEQTLRAVIEIADRTAGPLAGITQKFAAFEARIQRIPEHLKRLGEDTGVARLGEHFRETSEHARGLVERVGEIIGPLGVLAAGLFSAGGLGETVKSAAEFDEKMDLAAKSTGLTAQQLSGLSYSAKLANVDQDRLTRVLHISIARLPRRRAERPRTFSRSWGAWG